MRRFALVAALTLAATPGYANYGDVDAQIEAVQIAAVYVTQPQIQSTTSVATADTCTLPFAHIVSVPAQFGTESAFEMACLEE